MSFDRKCCLNSNTDVSNPVSPSTLYKVGECFSFTFPIKPQIETSNLLASLLLPLWSFAAFFLWVVHKHLKMIVWSLRSCFCWSVLNQTSELDRRGLCGLFSLYGTCGFKLSWAGVPWRLKHGLCLAEIHKGSAPEPVFGLLPPECT